MNLFDWAQNPCSANNFHFIECYESKEGWRELIPESEQNKIAINIFHWILNSFENELIGGLSTIQIAVFVINYDCYFSLIE